jgi:hypothetical protein
MSSARVGKEQEQRIVRHAKNNGFPGADRIIRTGAGKDYAVRDDEGDIWLCPGVIVQSKRLSPPNRMERAITGWLAETEAQRVASRAAHAVLVVRREGTTDIGEWWAWFYFAGLFAIRGCRIWDCWNFTGTALMPVRLTVADAYTLLRTNGYGTPLLQEAQ